MKLGLVYDLRDDYLALGYSEEETAEFDSRATAVHNDLLAVEFEDVDISSLVGLLRQGENVLAIHGLNRNATADALRRIAGARRGLAG